MGNESAWAGLGQALQNGADAYSKARAARMANERQSAQDAMASSAFEAEQKENTPSFDLGKGLFATRPEAVKMREIEMARKATSGAPGGMRLKPGERYNQQTDTVESVPGSDLYQVQAGKYHKDLTALNALKNSATMANEKIDKILGTKGNIESQYGRGYSGVLTGWTNPDAKANIQSLASNLKAQGLQLMKGGGGIGAISEKEWPIMEGLLGRLSSSISEGAARETLGEIKSRLGKMQQDAEGAHDLQWSNTQFVNPMRTGKKGQAGQSAQSMPEHKTLAEKILSDPEAGPDDIAWAKSQMGQ